MRKFNYLEDYNIISTTVNGYINQLLKEVSLLKSADNKIYIKAENMLNRFIKKYPSLFDVSRKINHDLIKPDNINYYNINKRYPEDASNIGLQFEKDLKKIFELEEMLKTVALKSWKRSLSKFDNIVNGYNFLVVGHASYNLPGTTNCSNYISNDYKNLYISCSVLSNKELNTYNGIKTVFLIEVDENNFIAASSCDSVTADINNPSFETLKEIGKNHYIKVGYTHDRNKAVTTISTPRLIEKLSLEREINQNKEMYNYDNLLTNEVVLDRTTSKYTGALLISNGCDLLIDEYLMLKQNNVKFKCINKGLYRKKHNMEEFTYKEYLEFIQKLNKIDYYYDLDNSFSDILLNYYYEVIIPMNYSDNVMKLINNKLSNYIEIPKGKKK